MKRNKPYIIGLTGSIGAGKSTCAELFKDHFHLPIIDADAIAYRVCEKDADGLKAIEKEFGPEYVLENGEYNRELMAKTVFDHPQALDKLNQILHPIIKKEREREIESLKDEPIIIYDCPLLFESGENEIVDEILMITVDEDLRKKRLEERNGYSEAEVEKRLKAQKDELEKMEAADTIIFNNGDLSNLKNALNNFLENLLI